MGTTTTALSLNLDYVDRAVLIAFAPLAVAAVLAVLLVLVAKLLFAFVAVALEPGEDFFQVRYAHGL